MRTIDRKFSGPKVGICVVCGKEIGAYESRWFGEDGAVHAWKPDSPTHEWSDCRTLFNELVYPHYYTDG